MSQTLDREQSASTGATESDQLEDIVVPELPDVPDETSCSDSHLPSIAETDGSAFTVSEHIDLQSPVLLDILADKPQIPVKVQG
jgi:hypothetical protein